jgi:hypothetical protein
MRLSSNYAVARSSGDSTSYIVSRRGVKAAGVRGDLSYQGVDDPDACMCPV